MRPQIDIMKCDGCGLCVSVCRQHGLVIINGVIAFVETIECDWCTQCEAVCTTGAISCPFDIVLG